MKLIQKSIPPKQIVQSRDEHIEPKVKINDFVFSKSPVSIADHAFQQERSIKPQIVNPVLGYKNSRRIIGDHYETVEYDLSYLLSLEDIESYVKQAYAKKLTLFFKEGWDFVGANPTTVEYIKKRFRQIASATNISTEQLIQATVSDLIKLNNCFWLLVRDDKKSGGYSIDGKKPIAGVFIIPAETVTVKTNSTGQIISIRQIMPDGTKKTYSKDNVVHFALNRKNGFAIGTPDVWPVIEDILALRRIEENIEKLIYRDLFPIYQYIVGTEKHPASINRNGKDELQVVREELSCMPAEGIFVTPERHEIRVVGNEGRALRIENYVKHFNQRVLSGLGLSSIDMGNPEGGSRGSAETMSQGLVDEVKFKQSCFEDMLNNLFIKNLLLEGDFSFDPLEPDNFVKIKFKEIDIANQLAIQNHYNQLFMQHGINHVEFREELGRLPADDEWWETSFWKLIGEPEIMAGSIAEPMSVGSQVLAAAPNSSVEGSYLSKAEGSLRSQLAAKQASRSGSSNSGARSGSARNRPSNQHGRKLESISRTDSIDIDNQSILFIQDSREVHDSIFSILSSLRRDSYNKELLNNKEVLRLTVKAVEENINKNLSKELKNSYISGFKSITTEPPVTAHAISSFNSVDEYSKSSVNRIFTVINDSIEGGNPKISLTGAIDASEWRFNFLLNTEVARAYNYGRLVGLKELGYGKYKSNSGNTDCADCVKISTVINDIGSSSLLTIPPHHPNCKCLLEGVR